MKVDLAFDETVYILSIVNAMIANSEKMGYKDSMYDLCVSLRDKLSVAITMPETEKDDGWKPT